MATLPSLDVAKATLRKKLAAPGTRSMSVTRSVGRALLDALDRPAEPRGFDTSAMTLTFEDRFATLDFDRWATVPIVNDEEGAGSSLPGNSERQWYINAAYGPTIELEPWRAGTDGLTITADRTPRHLRHLMGHDQAKFPELKGQFGLGSYDYYSGRLATHRSFSQLYGYFECDAKLPAGRGLWPAFWLLPLDMSWPPEIDVFEVLGHEPRRIYQTLHWREPARPDGDHKSAHVETEAFDTAADFHRYGVHWTKEFVAFNVDGRETKRFPTPAHMHRPMYMIVNLAVGGSWPGDPDETTAFPAEMKIRSVRAWQ